MRYETVTRRIGECIGPVDWSYDFMQHFQDATDKDERCKRAMDWLRQIEADKDAFVATTDGGWPRCGWGDVIGVGMYDGWPWWRPTPSVCIRGPFGGEWHSFYTITGVERKKSK